MLKSPRFAPVFAALSVAAIALSGPAFASDGAPDYRFKVKTDKDKTVFCAVRTQDSYQLPYQGCLTKTRWAQRGIAIDHEGSGQFAANDARSGRTAGRN